MSSETSRVRDTVMQYINPDMKGVDIGFGGDAICNTSINVDLPNRYTAMQSNPQHIFCDAQLLPMFQDNEMDYVYSSHMLEDLENTKATLIEWIRILKPGGLMILYLPHEERFRAWCAKTRCPLNPHHKNMQMSLEYIKNLFAEINQTEEIFTIDRHIVPGWQYPGIILDYSFLIIVRKKNND